MSVQIKDLPCPSNDKDIKQIKVEKKYISAFVDRYKRLGYVKISLEKETEDGKKYAVAVMERDKNRPDYDRLKEIEGEIGGFAAEAIEEDDSLEKKTRKHRLIARIMLFGGAAVVVAGIVMLICGFLNTSFALTISGWAVAIAGAVVLIVWSFLRESWHLRKVDVKDDAEFPGFGLDETSRQIENKLRDADKVRKSAKKQKQASE